MTQNEKYPLALPQGTILAGQYVIEQVLGQGGFGITYKATDHKTGQSVAVKEFFPDSLATRTTVTTVSAFSGARSESFAYGKGCFLQEAETLAQFIGNENIVRVFSYFEENGTAYFVMEFIEGKSLDQYIKECGGKLPYEEAEQILLPVIDALGAVHAKGIVHRDVTPDNIYITKDGTVKLLDFGAARYSLGDKSRSLDVVLKHGFAPKEQYTRRGKQGPFTDVYTLGASFYYAITGKRPPDSIDRMDEDELIPPSSMVRIQPEKEDAILKAMSVQPAERYQTMGEFREALLATPNDEALAAAVIMSPPVQQRLFTEAQPEALGRPVQVAQQGAMAASEMPQSIGRTEGGDDLQAAEPVQSETEPKMASAGNMQTGSGESIGRTEGGDGLQAAEPVQSGEAEPEEAKKKAIWASALLLWKSFTPKRKVMCACAALALFLVMISAAVFLIPSREPSQESQGSQGGGGAAGTLAGASGGSGGVLTSPESAHEHVWLKTGEVEASCEGNGSIDWSCSCGETRTETVPPAGHNWKETGRVEAVCEEGGSIDYVCSSCNETHTEAVPPAGHNWSETEIIAASCEKDGKGSYACVSCGETKTETLEKLGHSWSETKKVEATCDKKGSASYACSSCGKTKTETLEKLGHSWSETQKVEATCDKKGSVSYACSSCGKTSSETLAALGHSWSETGKVAASCDKKGNISYECDTCGKTRSEAVAALGHRWSETGKVAANCDTNGSVSYACGVCGKTRSEAVAATGHSWSETGRTGAGCDHNGSVSYACGVCGKTRSEVVAALAHSWSETGRTNPTCESGGNVSYRCGVCGTSRDESLAALGHDWVSYGDSNTVIVGGVRYYYFCRRCNRMK